MKKRKYKVILKSEDGTVLSQVEYDGISYTAMTASDYISRLIPGQTIEIKLEIED